MGAIKQGFLESTGGAIPDGNVIVGHQRHFKDTQGFPVPIYAFERVYKNLERAGLPTPVKRHTEVTPSEVDRHFQELLGAIIKREIETDPERVGYAGKTPEEQLELLLHREPVADDHPAQAGRKVKLLQPSRYWLIVHGVPHAPNTVTVEDLVAAKD